MRPHAHVQPSGDPRQRHRRLRAQATGDTHLARIALASLRQIGLLPVQLPQLLSHQPFRLGLPALLPFRPVMLRSHPLRCLRQQLLLQFVRPEKPTPPDRRPLLAAAFLPPRVVPLRSSRLRLALLRSTTRGGVAFLRYPIGGVPSEHFQLSLKYTNNCRCPVSCSDCSGLSNFARAGFKCTYSHTVRK